MPVKTSVTGGLEPPFFMLYYVSIQRRIMPQFTLIARDEDTVTTKKFESAYLQDVVEKTQDFLKGVGFCFEELHTQVYPVPESNDDDYSSVYKDVD